jgi:hypothetical protein
MWDGTSNLRINGERRREESIGEEHIGLLMRNGCNYLSYWSLCVPVLLTFSIPNLTIRAQFYTSVLSLITLYPPLKRAKTASRHVASILLVVLGLYAYRDIWPLGTYTLTPLDEKEGFFLWSRVTLLVFAGVVVPLVMPNQYIPLDPKVYLLQMAFIEFALTRSLQNPQEEPNPEQTASLLSFVTFSWLDSIIFYAYKQPHLPWDKLPPLCDYDRTEHLTKTTFKVGCSTRLRKKF